MSGIRKRLTPVIVFLAAAAAVWAIYFKPPPAKVPGNYTDAGRPPDISPDYADCVIPPNIAPLNFVVREPGSQYRVRAYGDGGEGFVVSSRTTTVAFPAGKWRRLLEANRGGEVFFDVYVRREGKWRKFTPVVNTVAPEPIDPYVVYRLLGPVHNYVGQMAICQRNITNFDESPVLRSERVAEASPCFNCHTFVNNDPGRMIMHLRSRAFGNAMLVADDNGISKVAAGGRPGLGPAAYTSWHPSGKIAAFSMNSLALQHQARGESRDVFDHASDLGVYVVASNSILYPEAISQADYLETFPAWSPDGRDLYFVRTPRAWPEALARSRALPTRYDEIRYDLVKVNYDLAGNQWGPVEPVLAGDDVNASITEPRPSPDGKFVLFTTAPYGNFPIYMDGSDLHMLEIATGRHWPLAINSDRADTWHSWSSNGRWIVFSSKRRNGRLFARLYFSYIDADGRSHKPVVLPQKDPTFYDSFLKTYNAPELATGRVAFSEDEIKAAIISSPAGQDVSVISGATPHDAPGQE